MYHTRTKEGFAFAHSVSAAEFDQIACDQQRSLRVRCEQTQFERLLRCVETRVDTAIFVQENRPSIGTGRRTAIRSIRDVVVINAQERDVVIVLESFDSHAAADLARDAEHMATRLRELRNTVNALTETNGGLLSRVADLEPRALDEQSSFLAWACVALVKMHLPYDPIARVLRGDVEGLEGIHENSVADIARFFANAPAPYSVHAQRALDRVRLAHTLRELSRKRGQTKTTFALADGGDTETKLLTPSQTPATWLVPSLQAAMDVVLVNGLDACDVRFVRARRTRPLESPNLASVITAASSTSASTILGSMTALLASTQNQIDAFVGAYNAVEQSIGGWEIEANREIDVSPEEIHDALKAATERREMLANRKARDLALGATPSAEGPSVAADVRVFTSDSGGTGAITGAVRKGASGDAS